MDLILFFALCWWTAAARSYWSDTPTVLVSSDEIEDGETVKVTCLLPIDYTGGECRLYWDDSPFPFRRMTTRDFFCDFTLTSKVVLGKRPVGTRVYLRCDYHLQQYTSVKSDIRGVTVWGSSPSPTLTVSRRFVLSDDSVEVTCSPPLGYASSCHFYRGEDRVAEGSCSRNLTGSQLAIWEKSTVLLPVNMTCRYDPHMHLYIRSKPSNHLMLFVVDTSQGSSMIDCKVSVDDDQLIAGGSRTFVGGDEHRVNVHLTNSSLTENPICLDRT